MTADPATRWTIVPRPRPQAALRLLCFPYAVGSASLYAPWADLLPDWVEMHAVELPGHGSRKAELPLTRLDSLVEVAARGLAPLFDRPFALFGHSMGALLAFELARWLQRHGPSPQITLVAGRGAAHLPDPGPMLYAATEEALINELLRLGGTTPVLLDDPSRLERLIALTRADFAVCETYSCRDNEPLTSPLAAFGGTTDPDWHESHLAVWSQHTTNSFALHMFPGDHFFLHSARPQLLERIAQALSSTGTPGSTAVDVW